VHEKLAALLRDDARCVLPTVLQKQQAVVNQLVNGSLANDADYAARGGSIVVFLGVGVMVV
jgi:hypothetical protein